MKLRMNDVYCLCLEVNVLNTSKSYINLVLTYKMVNSVKLPLTKEKAVLKKTIIVDL